MISEKNLTVYSFWRISTRRVGACGCMLFL